jgi:hypothetical protein
LNPIIGEMNENSMQLIDREAQNQVHIPMEGAVSLRIGREGVETQQGN